MKATIQIRKSEITVDIDKQVNMPLLMHHVWSISKGLEEHKPKAELTVNDDFSMTLTYNERPVIEPGKPAIITFFFDSPGGVSCDIKTGGETMTAIYNAVQYLQITYSKQLLEAGKILWFGDEKKAANWVASIINKGL